LIIAAVVIKIATAHASPFPWRINIAKAFFFIIEPAFGRTGTRCNLKRYSLKNVLTADLQISDRARPIIGALLSWS